MKLPLVSILLLGVQTTIACLGFASRHDLFLPLNGTLAVENQIPLNSAGYGVADLTKGAYMVTDGVYQSLVLVSTAGVILVDAPPTLGHKLQWAIGNLTTLPVRWFIYSHSHADHVGGAYLFTQPHKSHNKKEKLTLIAHENTATQLSTSKDPHRPPPTQTFRTKYTLRAGNQTLHLHFPGISHDLGNIIIYAPTQKVLMMVDQVYPGWVPFAELAASVYVPGWITAHDEILAYDFDVYLGGHLGGAGNRTDVEVQREYVRDLFENCEGALVKSGTGDGDVGLGGIAGDVLAANPGNYWALFGVYIDAVAELCYNLTSEKWLGRLAGQDVFGFGHARKLVESLRLDYDVLGPNGVQP